MDRPVFDPRTRFESTDGDARVQTEIYGDCVFCDSAGDFDLPDYLPEIRKLLRVSSKVIPSGQFVGGERAEFGGSVAHTVVYTDPDGALCATSLTSDYEISVPIPKCDGEEPAAVCDSTVDSTTYRLVGPRRLSLRARLRNNLRITCNTHVPRRPDVTCSCELETLSDENVAARSLHARSGEFTLTDIHRLEGVESDNVKVIFCGGEIHAEEAAPFDGGIRCRGSVWCRAVISDGGTPYSVAKKIPFEENVVCAEASEGFRCNVYGICTSMEVTPTTSVGGGTELVFDVTSELVASATANLPFSAVTDAFSPNKAVVCRQSRLSASGFCGSAMGNFSISGSAPKEGDAGGAVSIIDTDGRVKSYKAVAERGRAVVTGECSVSLLLALPPSGVDGRPAYASCEYDLPFRCELDTHSHPDDTCRFDCHVDFLGAKSRIDTSSFVTDAEICVALTARKDKTVAFLASAEEDTDAAPTHDDGKIRIYYPSDSDSLWSVAKKYGVSRTSLAAANGLPEASVESSALSHSIDGISCLIIE